MWRTKTRRVRSKLAPERVAELAAIREAGYQAGLAKAPKTCPHETPFDALVWCNAYDVGYADSFKVYVRPAKRVPTTADVVQWHNAWKGISDATA